MIDFGGISEEFRRADNSRIVILPVPYDGTSTWVKGSDKGPEALLNASANMELYDIETDSEVFQQGIYTAPPVLESYSPEQMTEAVRNEAAGYIARGKFVVTLGGEHSVSIGTIQAHAAVYKDLTVLQIDAHTDLREEYEGSRFNHACVMARVRELCPFVQVGIRSMDVSEKEYLIPENVFYAKDIVGSQRPWMDYVIDKLTRDVYITLDLDGLDPSVMPSTGTPEPGGLSYYEVIRLIKKVIVQKNLVGMDVVELCPNPHNKAPDFLASKLIYEVLSSRFKKY